MLGTCEGLLLGVGPGRRHMDSGPAAATYILLYMKEWSGVDRASSNLAPFPPTHSTHIRSTLCPHEISGPPVCVTAGRVGVRGGIIRGGFASIFLYVCVRLSILTGCHSEFAQSSLLFFEIKLII